MKRMLAIILVVFLAIGVFAAVGCGEKKTATNGKTTDGTEDGEPTTEPYTRPVAGPEELVTAYCELLIDDQYEEAAGYWDENYVEKMVISTNALKEVVNVTASGSGDTRQVTADVKYIQCESGETLEGTIDFTLHKKDGLWKITSAEADYESLTP